jgi:hypothetical protein
LVCSASFNRFAWPQRPLLLPPWDLERSGAVVLSCVEYSSRAQASAVSQRSPSETESVVHPRRDISGINHFVGFDCFAGHRLSRPRGLVVCRIESSSGSQLLIQQTPSETESRHCSEKARESQRAVAEPCRKRPYRKVRVLWRKVDVVERQEEQQKSRKSSGLKGCAARNNLYSPPCDG